QTVRDRSVKREAIRERGQPVRYEDVEADPGEADKRLLCLEEEFATVLRVMERQGNTLSVLLRPAWGGVTPRATTKTPQVATGAHVSIVAHVTEQELRRYLSATEQANGFGNRFIWLAVERSKLLPFGGSLEAEALADLQGRTAKARAFAEQLGA